ncbi:response regulator transcription factor [Tistrella mobilis]|uniref:response regulator n=1 Tax=Tistrella mobilis TaxID=171437 RepID=UPI003555FFB5
MRVLLADDHALFREGLGHVLAAILEQPQAIEAGGFADAISIAAGSSPLDLMVIDLNMPDMEGFAGIAALRRHRPAVPILVLTASETAEDMYAALEAGASGYVAKSAGRDELARAIGVVTNGGTFVPRGLAAGGAIIGTPPASASLPRALTSRQRDVAELVARGLSNKRIALTLGMTEGTVKTHLAAVMRALGVRNRVEVALHLAGTVSPSRQC